MSSIYGSTTQRVLAIPEILELVFSFLCAKDNAVCARVCKGWSEVALDTLWREVDDLRRFFGLLAPVETAVDSTGTPEYYEHFRRPLEPADWIRFMRYATRVRKLLVLPAEDSHLRGHLVFDEIARTRSTLNILPKLSSLTWESGLDGERLRLSLMFMHENVKSFTVRLIRSESYSLGIFFQEIALRMPKLTLLDLRFTFAVRDIEQELCALFKALPQLRKVILPKFTLTSKIIERLSKSPKLQVVQFEFLEFQGSGDVSDVHNWLPALEEDTFPALNDLSISVHLPHMTRFLNAEYTPANLQCLYVHTLYTVPPYQVHDFFDAAAQNCPLLKQLYLDFSGDPSPLLFRTSLAGEDRITWNTLRPLLKFSKLTDFELHWDTPLALTQDDVEQLAMCMPAIEVLMLNSEPIPTLETPPLTLRALIPFARHCPKIRELALYIDASANDLDAATHELRDALPSVRFRALRMLSVGLSRITVPEPVAIFLSLLCPPECRIGAGVSWPNGPQALEPEDAEARATLADIWTHAMQWHTRWMEVDRMLPLLTKVRLEEHSRRAELEREVEGLRVRARLLEERLNVGVPQDGGCILL
ncbi:hypothetical protein C8Q78DRAFT_1048133 [Trametes maxima]|nr:hypothetical protein C8Q78DRAFT_1048133 [Trametes maxima]